MDQQSDGKYSKKATDSFSQKGLTHSPNSSLTLLKWAMPTFLTMFVIGFSTWVATVMVLAILCGLDVGEGCHALVVVIESGLWTVNRVADLIPPGVG